MRRPIRALVLEDNDDIRAYLVEMMKARGYEVFDYADPVMCPLAKEHDCKCGDDRLCSDIFILDLKMPNMSGVDFVEMQSKKECKACCVAIMSNSWTTDEVNRAEALGCAVFDKPARTIILEHWLDQCETKIDRNKTLNSWFRDGTETNELKA